MNHQLIFTDLIVPVIYLLLFYFIAQRTSKKHIETAPEYRFYTSGLFAKLIGAILICLVYIYYYGGGDTVGYYKDCVAISKLFLKNPWQAIRFTFLPLDADMWFAMDESTGYVLYAYDIRAVRVDKIVWPLCLISMQSFFGTTMLLAFLCYLPIWRLFRMFCSEFPDLQKQFAFAIFFIPSVCFWGSGLLKDSITFAAAAQYTASFHHLLKVRTHSFRNLIYIVIASYFLIAIKPYIFFALLPGTLLWFIGFRISNLQNRIVRSMLIPAMVVFAIGSAYVILRVMGETLGEFSVNRVIEKAQVTQQDLKQEYYGGASFDIGQFDPTIPGMLKKSPKAIMAALFRPYLWEAYNPGMIISGIENLFLLIFTIILIIRLRVIYLFTLLFRHHILFFSVSFSIFFAFSVGLTSSNFGSMVRYKIPAIPFFLASLFIIRYTYKQFREEKKIKVEELYA